MPNYRIIINITEEDFERFINNEKLDIAIREAFYSIVRHYPLGVYFE
jgi:hypothetical protein